MSDDGSLGPFHESVPERARKAKAAATKLNRQLKTDVFIRRREKSSMSRDFLTTLGVDASTAQRWKWSKDPLEEGPDPQYAMYLRCGPRALPRPRSRRSAAAAAAAAYTITYHHPPPPPPLTTTATASANLVLRPCRLTAMDMPQNSIVALLKHDLVPTDKIQRMMQLQIFRQLYAPGRSSKSLANT